MSRKNLLTRAGPWVDGLASSLNHEHCRKKLWGEKHIITLFVKALVFNLTNPFPRYLYCILLLYM